MTDRELEIRSIPRRCRGPLHPDAAEKVTEAIRAGELEAAATLDKAGRKGCGYDFNETIMAGPMDGEEHVYTCPSCGLQGEYRAPYFED